MYVKHTTLKLYCLNIESNTNTIYHTKQYKCLNRLFVAGFCCWHLNPVRQWQKPAARSCFSFLGERRSDSKEEEEENAEENQSSG